MITIEQACINIETLKLPYVRVYDNAGNIIYAIENGENAPSTAEALKNILPVFSLYGKVIVKAATKTQYDGSYKSCTKWDVKVSDAPAATAGNNQMLMQQQMNPYNQMVQMMQMMQMMQQMQQPNVNMQLEYMRKEMDLHKQMWEFQKQSEDPISKYAPLFPLVGKAMGWKSEEMKEMLMMSGMAKQWGNSTMPAMQQQKPWTPLGQPTHTAGTPAEQKPNLMTDGIPVPTFEQLQSLNPDQKLAEINALLLKVADVVPAEDMIMLLSILYNRPKLAPKAIQLYNAGMLND